MNGQRCTAGLAAARAAGRSTSRSSPRSPSARSNIRVGDPFDPRTELGPLIHPEHHARVLGYIAVGARARARVSSPAASARRSCRGGNFLQATVIADVDET